MTHHSHSASDTHRVHDWSSRARDLTDEGEIQAAAVGQAIDWLAALQPLVDTVYDIGCGPGVAATALARHFPTAHVYAVDSNDALLTYASQRASDLNVGDRFTTMRHNIEQPFPEPPAARADLVWMSDVLHHIEDPVAALSNVRSLMAPTGLLALREGGLPLRFLPERDTPGLASRMDAAMEEMRACYLPDAVVDDQAGWPEILTAAGFEPVDSSTFVIDHPSPLDGAARQWLHRHLSRLWSAVGDRLARVDRERMPSLVRLEAPGSVLHSNTVFIRAAFTVYAARSDAG